MRAGDIGTAIWLDNTGVKFDELELVDSQGQGLSKKDISK